MLKVLHIYTLVGYVLLHTLTDKLAQLFNVQRLCCFFFILQVQCLLKLCFFSLCVVFLQPTQTNWCSTHALYALWIRGFSKFVYSLGCVCVTLGIEIRFFYPAIASPRTRLDSTLFLNFKQSFYMYFQLHCLCFKKLSSYSHRLKLH